MTWQQGPMGKASRGGVCVSQPAVCSVPGPHRASCWLTALTPSSSTLL
jgi:hypothetical protein